MTALLTLGPLLYYWPGIRWRDFYLRIAEEAPVDVVYLGEVVCPKRWPLQADYLPQVVERLERAGKTVVMSTPALVVDRHDEALVQEAVQSGRPVEINDVAAFEAVEGRPHVIGPYISVYNERALAHLAEQGAFRVVLPVELPRDSLQALARPGAPEVEVQVYGRWPLAISARCYHARAYGRSKATCQFACGDDPDGLAVRTLDGEFFLTINGVQTQSHAYAGLVREVPELVDLGVRAVRLSPQQVDMVRVATAYRDLLDGRLDPGSAEAAVAQATGGDLLANGFYHGQPGADWVAPASD